MNIEESVESKYIDSLDNTIEFLKNAKNNGENIYVDFGSENGVIRLYSVDIDDDAAYLRIYGLNKEQKKSYDEEIKTSSNKDEVEAKYQNMIAVYFDKLRDDSTKLDFKGSSVYELIKTLNECKKLNKNIYIDYKSTEDDMPIRFYSMDINVDRAFLSIMGLTKSQYDENKERFKMARSDEELQMVITDFYQMMKENEK